MQHLVRLEAFSRGCRTIENVVKTLPSLPGVYRMLDSKGRVLYVGKAKNLKKRVASYTQKMRLNNRLQRMVSQTVDLEVVVTHTESEALLLEANLIKKFYPPFNIILKDNKSLSHIVVTKDAWPLLMKYRGASKPPGQAFGPFISVAAIEKTLGDLHRVFLLRSCTNAVFQSRKRPCLQYDIKRCSAPCVGKISHDAYKNLVQQAVRFLSGKSQDIQKELALEMESCSQAQEYEKAALLRDRIQALTKIQSHQFIYAQTFEHADIFAIYHEAGRCCVQVFFFRHRGNYGTQSFFPEHDPSETPGWVLQAFLMQFYEQYTVPPLILLNQDLPERLLVQQALQQKADFSGERGPVLHVPQKGEKKTFVHQAEENARHALWRQRARTESIQKNLKKIVQLFDLPHIPQRIEVYDNSHLMGTQAVGAMIVASPEGFIKTAYRKFKIHGQFTLNGQKHIYTPGDDLGMMREVFSRRFEKNRGIKQECEKMVMPDFILIDGGQGQIKAACEILNILGISIPVVGIAKGKNRNAGQETFFLPSKPPFQLDFQDPVLYYLQQLRDEVHRYAILAHRRGRQQQAHRSSLDDIPGIGPARKRVLLRTFGSLNGIKGAGIQDLKAVAGISQAVAKKIYDYFKTNG